MWFGEVDTRMSTESQTSTREEELRDQVQTFLSSNFPQIQMHGGSASIESMDVEEGELWLSLGGACSGCGISPMTVTAIQKRLPEEIPQFSVIHVDTSAEEDNSLGASIDGEDGDEEDDAPF